MACAVHGSTSHGTHEQMHFPQIPHLQLTPAVSAASTQTLLSHLRVTVALPDKLRLSGRACRTQTQQHVSIPVCVTKANQNTCAREDPDGVDIGVSRACTRSAAWATMNWLCTSRFHTMTARRSDDRFLRPAGTSLYSLNPCLTNYCNVGRVTRPS